MNIAIDIRLIGKHRTGDEAVFLNLTRELLSLDHANRYLLLTDVGSASRLADIRTKLGVVEGGNAEIISLPAGNRFIWNLVAVPTFLFRNRVDIFHTQYILPAFIPKRTKVVAHIHDVSFRVYPELIGWKDRFFLDRFIPRTMARADLLVAPSRFTKDEIMKWYGVPDERIAVVPNALAPDFVRAVTDIDLVRVRQKYRLPEKFFLHVGTLQPRKNIPFLLRAFAGVRDRIPGASVVLVGNRTGHHYDTGIDRMIDEKHLGSAVMFPGFVDTADLPALYRLATACVVPSKYEGFGIPILEAFAAVTPVAASDIPPFREVGGDAIRVFDPDSVAECGETLYTLYTDFSLGKSLIQKGNERLSAYSWPESARVLFSCYERLSDNL